MLTLALDTAAETISLGLGTAADQIHLLQTRTLPHSQAEQLFPALDTLFRLAGHEPHQVQRIVVATGPGSYTGLRNGLAVARTLAQLNNIPVMGIGSLALLRARTPLIGLISPWLDIRRGEVYTELIKRSWSPAHGDTLDVLEPPGVQAAAAWAAQLAARDEPVAMVGDGANAWQARPEQPSLRLLDEGQLAPAAGTLLRLAFQPEAGGTPLRWSDYREVMPLYPDRPVARERSGAS